jgi:hypothetical protein
MPPHRRWLVAEEDYIEVDAVVRMPKGERLADSKKTEGWSRGFTPNSPDKGPEHVEIRLRDEGEGVRSEPELEPQVVHIHEYIGPQQSPEPTLVELLAAKVLHQAIDVLVEAAKPHVVHWRDTKAIPAVRAKCDDFVLKLQARKVKKANREANTVALVPQPMRVNEAAAQEVATTLRDPKITMTSVEYQQVVLALLATDEFRDKLLHVLASAHVEDSDPAALTQLQELSELPTKRRAERVTELLAGNPSILEDLGRHLMERGPEELRVPVRRIEKA